MARPRKVLHRPSGAGTRIYLGKNVVQAAYDRLELLFDEFPNIIVRVSGGKDSTVLMHLALEVAERKDRLPLKVYWLDQEAEWQATVDIVSDWMHRPDVEPMWLQVPFRIFNASSQTDHWLHAWDPAAEGEWIHPRDPVALTENVYGSDRFADLFGASLRHTFPSDTACSLAGVRAEESPNRRKGLTTFATYKWITWGNVEDKRRGHYTFYPLYDWSFFDIWKLITERGWAYNTIYETQYRYGVPLNMMRVSNLHHETAVHSLFYLQEFEPETYDRMVARIGGIDMAGKLGIDDYFPRELPFMFRDWGDYRDYLLEHLVEAEYRAPLAHRFNEHDRKIPEPMLSRQAHRMHVSAILTCDWESVKLDNYFHSPQVWQAQRDNKPNWKTVEEVPLPSWAST